MNRWSLSRLGDRALLRALSSLAAQDRATTADILAYLAEVDMRRLYLPAGYSSLFAYCLEALHFSEDVACKRIQAARAARMHPALFAAVADGRLHLAAVCLLAPHLEFGNVDALIDAATCRTKAQVERLLAERFVTPVQLGIVPVDSAPPTAPAVTPIAGQPAPGQENGPSPAPTPPPMPALPTALATSASPAAPIAPPPLEPRLVVRLALSLSTQDKLRRAQALLSHAVPSGDPAEIVDRALDALLVQLERRKHAATDTPRPPRGPQAVRPPRAGKAPRPTITPRFVPAHVRRAVWARDQGRCTFVGAGGRRCTSRTRLEFDHRDPVARGGQASVERVRLLCRAHNQFEAERTYGAGFMRRKREAARERARAQTGDRARPVVRSTCPGAGDPGGADPSG